MSKRTNKQKSQNNSPFSVGDMVSIKKGINARVFNLPRYIEDGSMEVIGYGNKNVICLFCNEFEYSVPTEILEKIAV